MAGNGNIIGNGAANADLFDNAVPSLRGCVPLMLDSLDGLEGPTEAVNLLIETIRRIGHGHRNFDNYRRRLLLGWGIT